MDSATCDDTCAVLSVWSARISRWLGISGKPSWSSLANLAASWLTVRPLSPDKFIQASGGGFSAARTSGGSDIHMAIRNSRVILEAI